LEVVVVRKWKVEELLVEEIRLVVEMVVERR